MVAGCGQPPRYRETDASAASGDDDIMHRDGPAFLPP
jgi:hypothetical protein